MFGLKTELQIPIFSSRASNNQDGQAAVIVLLIVAVVATMGLSQLGRTTEDVYVSSQREESSRVFNAAEYGVEEALSDEGHFGGGANTSKYKLDDLDVDVTIEPASGEMETSVPEGESLEIDLVGFNGSKNFVVNWDQGNGGNCNLKASLMISIFQKSGTAYYYFINPSGCQKGSGFAAAASGSGGYGSKFDFNVDGNSDKLIRITPLHASTNMRVTGSGVIMAHVIRSVSQTTEEGGGEGSSIQQKIEVQRLSPSSPSFMDFALYTNGKIEQIE